MPGSPLPSRTSRRSAIESDSDDSHVATPMKPKSARKARHSVVQKIVEESEEENEGHEGSPAKIESSVKTASEKDLNISNDDELELRTRSISKSPIVTPKSREREAYKSNGNEISTLEFDTPLATPKEELPKKFFKQRINLSEQNVRSGLELDYPDETVESPIKKFESKSKRNSDPQTQVTYENVCERLTKTVSVIKKESGDVEAVDSFSAEKTTVTTKEINESSLVEVAVDNTPIRARRSIHGDNEQDELSRLMEDFVAETPKAIKTPKSAKRLSESLVKTPLETPSNSQKTPANGKFEEAPESDKKSLSVKKTPASARNTPQSLKASQNSDKFAQVVESSEPSTPLNSQKLSAKKTPASVKTTPASVKKTPKTFIVEEAPASGKNSLKMKNESPAYGNTTAVEVEDMEISKHEEGDESDASKTETDMEITLASPQKSSKADKLSRSWSQSVTKVSSDSPQKSQGKTRQSLSAYIDQVSSGAAKRNSQNVASSVSENEPEEKVVQQPRCWNQSVVKRADESIDRSQQKQEPEVIKADGTETRKEISSDESNEEHEKNSFVDDECEVGSKDSISDSERNYMRENEIPDYGESIGSQDSIEMELREEDDDEENDSFIEEDEVSDSYSMDSHEKEIEKSPPKRKSRIILQSSSDDEAVVLPKPTEKLRRKSLALAVESEDDENIPEQPKETRLSLNKSAAKEKQTNGESKPVSLKKPKPKRQRESESELDESQLVVSKRVKLAANDTIFDIDGDVSGVEENEQESSSEEDEYMPEVKVVKKPVKSSAESSNIESVMSHIDLWASRREEEMRVQRAKKRAKKAEKIALKEAKKAAAETLDSSTGENKENTIKKKKKKIFKKQKTVSGKFK